MSQLLQNRKANINDLNKGFVFFMEQERAQIKKVRNEERKKRSKVQEVPDGQPEPKEWWDDAQNFHPISEWTLQRNEWVDVEAEV